MLFQFAADDGGDLIIDVNNIQSISPLLNKSSQNEDQNKSLDNDNNHSVSDYVVTLANQDHFVLSVENYKGFKKFLIEKGLLELAYEKDSDQEDAKEKDISVQPEYTELKKALREIKEKTFKEINALNELISSLDQDDIKTVEEHEKLEGIADIVRDYTDSNEAIKAIDDIIFGRYDYE